MNKLLLISLLVSIKLSAQVADYFADQPTWRVSSACAVPYPCIQREDIEYFLGPDSLIGGRFYHIIFKRVNGEFLYQSPLPGPPGCSGTYSYTNDTAAIAFLRQDGQKMMIWVPSLQAEELLYDFDLVVGDTIPDSHINFLGAVDTVISVDSVMIRGDYRRVIQTSEGLELIEGIGSNRGLLEPMDLIFDCGYERTCFSLADTSWLPNPGVNCFMLVDYGAVIQEMEIRIGQQIGNNGFWVDLPMNSGLSEYSLHDLTGKLIFCGFLNPGVNYLTYQKDLCSGVYILHLSLSGFRTSRKLFVHR